MPAQRKQLILDIKKMQQEQKIFFPNTSKLSLIELQDMHAKLQNSANVNCQNNLSKNDEPKILEEMKQLQLKPSKDQQLLDEKKEQEENDQDEDEDEGDEDDEYYDDDDEDEGDEEDEFEVRNPKQDDEVTPLSNHEVDVMIIYFNKAVNDILQRYDPDDMTGKDKDNLIKNYNSVKAELDRDMVYCVDNNLRNRVNECVTANLESVKKYLSD